MTGDFRRFSKKVHLVCPGHPSPSGARRVLGSEVRKDGQLPAETRVPGRRALSGAGHPGAGHPRAARHGAAVQSARGQPGTLHSARQVVSIIGWGEGALSPLEL